MTIINRALLSSTLVFMLTGTLTASVLTPWKHPAHDSNRSDYVRNTFSAKSAAASVAGATINQSRNVPSEWGKGASGFGKRFASSFGTHIVNNTIRYSVARLRHEELSYTPSGKQGFGPRLKYALESTVITHKTTTGNKTVATGNISGAFGSGLISRAWQPASTGTLAGGLSSGGITLGITASTHVAREFWPHHHHATS
jgi:hypothetical protein